MKIVNEKSLLHLATSDYLTDKEGYLYKKTELSKGFQKRWFVLKGNLLFYFGKKGEREPLGVIILEGYTIELAEDMENFVFMINFTGVESKAYYLGAKSQEMMESWMKILSCAGYDFMKLKILELQSRVEELSLTGVNLVKAAIKDGQILSHVYGTESACSSCDVDNKHAVGSWTLSDPSHDHGHPACSQCSKGSPAFGQVSCPVSSTPKVDLVTWPVLGLQSFTEMHDFVKQQIDRIPN
ncbi:unnamed protein product [Candidula unifasciata]|uniref:PH domain-containing protein n=1 Tax=Candidula unifasciata TaxID=100452 RepID=A0A8S3ZK61_9EUPU|nr:unnamed protein product [Candidula unifasciata]